MRILDVCWPENAALLCCVSTYVSAWLRTSQGVSLSCEIVSFALLAASAWFSVSKHKHTHGICSRQLAFYASVPGLATLH